MSYDSRPDTWDHIALVQRYIGDAIDGLLDRSAKHDKSKLEPPEKQVFDTYTPKLRETEYGSALYKQYLEAMGEGLRHHYAVNSHHPEHYDGGIRDMSLLDLVEMLCDWKAAGERHESGGDIVASIEKNQVRFGYSDELKSILLATAKGMGWV